MSLSISSSLPSLLEQQSLVAISTKSSPASPVSNMEDTYTPSSESNSHWNAAESAVHQMDNAAQVASLELRHCPLIQRSGIERSRHIRDLRHLD